MDVRNIKTIDFGLSIVYAKREEKAHRDREKEGLDGTVYRRSAAKCLWCILGMTAVISGILSMQPDAVEAIVYCCG